MGTRQTEETGKCRGPLVPPEGAVCFINDLPPELLCHIFELSCANHGELYDADRAIQWAPIRRHYAKWARQIQEDVDTEEEPRNESTRDEGQGSDNGNVGVSSTAPYDSYRPFPIIISFVCRHWRSLALSSPSLWSDIEVCPIKGQSFQPESLMLERSQNLPLDIRVDCRFHQIVDDAEPPSDTELASFFHMLLSHIHRWRTMIVDASRSYDLMYVFLKAVSDSSVLAAPQLKTLELYHHECTDEFDSFEYPDMAEQITLFGGSAPLLTRLVLWGVHVDWNQPWIASAPNLQEIELSSHAEDVRPSLAQFATILQGASALRTLSLYRSGPSGDPAEWSVDPSPESFAGLNMPVVLAQVTELSLGFHSQARAIGFFRKFYLPALKTLILEFDDGDYTDFVHELARPAPSSSSATGSLLSRLHCLQIMQFPCTTAAISTLYGELRNLTSLTLRMTFLHPLFLDILAAHRTLPGRNDVLLPRLSHLYVAGTSFAAVRNVVQSRREAGAPLAAQLVYPTEIDVEFDSSDDGDEIVDLDGSDEENDEWTDVDED